MISIERGKQLYFKHCFICHQINGEGVPGSFPPLAGSDFLMADKERSIRIVCEGISGPITVNGKHYESLMPPMTMGDSDTADILSYVRNSWSNSGANVTPDEVTSVRAIFGLPIFANLQKSGGFAPLPPPRLLYL